MTVTEPLKAGSTISAFLDDIHIEGEVLCVDAPRKLLVIQASSSSGRRGTCDVILARMEFLRDIKTLKEGSAISFPELNINKVFSIPVARRCYPFQIAERISKNERIQQEKQKFYGPDVPPEARDLAEHIEKTLFKLTRATGPRQPSVSEPISETDDTLTYKKARRLERWADHFEGQFNWPPASTVFPPQTFKVVPWSVNLEPLTRTEVHNCIPALKRDRAAAGPDGLVPALFKEGGEALVDTLIQLFQLVWTMKTIPPWWDHAIVVLIFEKGRGSGISDVVYDSVSQEPALVEQDSIELTATVKVQCLETDFCASHQQLATRPIDQPLIASVVNILRRSPRNISMNYLLKCVKGERACISQVAQIDWMLYSQTASSRLNVILPRRSLSRVPPVLLPNAYMLMLSSKGCPISPFLFNFVVDDIWKGALHESSGLGVELLPGTRLTDLEHADDIVLLSSSAGNMQTMLNRVSDRAGSPVEAVDSFTYLGSTISSACNIADEISARIAKTRVAFSKLRHLWRRKDVWLSLKCRVYNARVRFILLYGSETWPVHEEDINKLAVFDHRCLRQLAHIKWTDRVSNVVVRRRVFRNARDARSIGQLIMLHSLRWLGQVLRMPTERLPYRALYSEVTDS
ncbi:uncharacterized protein DEA37_0001689 [Paragonimus westermani]|uniref:Reverse transcriptase domain-containing protein n=1 Tax=Paragonimus westermani TaxID=34504 RepID=A0A5J4N9N8_9TREM|nr:uncharacterized protein DEA37_0001689 [Paragonimus westermani]